MAKFDPAQIRDSSINRPTKNETSDYVPVTTPVQNFVQIRPLEASQQRNEI